MTHFSVLCWSILAALFAILFMDVLLHDPVRAGETVEQPAPAAVTQIQPGTDADRITSWYGYELKLIGPNRLGIFLEGGGLVGTKSCGCSGGDGLCRAVVAETPHYSLCAGQKGNPCTGGCKFE